VLADEAQDFSTLEMSLLRQLVQDPGGQDRFFFVGDLNQKVFPKHFRPRLAGFSFQGRVKAIRRNYRNTQQILRAAYLLADQYPPPREEDVPIVRPEFSPYEGSKPLVIQCTKSDQAATVANAFLVVLRRTKGQRVAVVSDNNSLLDRVRKNAMQKGIECFELFSIEDMDRWREQMSDPLAARLVFSKPEAVKGFEFDSVILCDLSAKVVPREGTPERERWRAAAVYYTAMTRARDELVLTYADEPSVFLKVIAKGVEWVSQSADKSLLDIIAKQA
jgi:superfamily I DNA/RNA helicase